MLARVLGSAAGGGSPQWNCACAVCALVRAGDPRVRTRTQDSMAVRGDGDEWHLVNASPDVRAQLEATPALHPRAARGTPIRSIVLTNGDLDHTLGLFSLRESSPLVVWATDAVREGLEARNAMMRTLHRFPEHLTWNRLELGVVSALGCGLTLEARALPGKPPAHLMGLVTPSAEDNVALWFRHQGRTLVYAAACGSLDGLERSFDDADALLFDGTFWSDDELVALGLAKARASDMAHLPIGGEGGSLSRIARTHTRRIYTHVNNTNPILVEGSPEHGAVVRAGWEIAFDGMDVVP